MFQDKVAFITGGSRGIGKACACVLSEAGAHVIITGRDLTTLNQASSEIESQGGQVLPVKMDVANPDQIKMAFAKVMESFGRIDILVNNAGVTKDNLLLRMKEEDWLTVIETNLTATFFITKMAIKIMLKQRYGRIINISSVVGMTGNAGQANYAASKAGMLGFTKTIAQEVASRNITVNAVAPGFVDTVMTQRLSEATTSKLLDQIPMGRIGVDREIAYGVKFLASEEASYITGEVLNINGGLYM